MKNGVYLDTNGTFPHLKGERALLDIREDAPNTLTAQFNNTSFPQAYGWWTFDRADFEIETPTEERTADVSIV